MNKGNLDDAKRRNQQSAQNLSGQGGFINSAMNSGAQQARRANQQSAQSVSGQGGMQAMNSTAFNSSTSQSNLQAVKRANENSRKNKGK